MRRSTSSEIIESKSLIKGFLTPMFLDENNNMAALAPDDFRKVRDGYACGMWNCLCEYTTYLVRCPVCGYERDLARDLADPDPFHVDYLKYRNQMESAHEQDEFDSKGNLLGPDGKPVPLRPKAEYGKAPNPFDEFMAGVEANPDTDHAKMSEIMPRKRH